MHILRKSSLYEKKNFLKTCQYPLSKIKSSNDSQILLARNQVKKCLSKAAIQQHKREVRNTFKPPTSLPLYESFQGDNKVNQNQFTLNLIQNHVENNLSFIQSIANAKSLLVSKRTFHHFQEQNKQNGVYKQSLSEALQKYQRPQQKIHLTSGFKIKTRRNIFQLQNKLKSQSNWQTGIDKMQSISKNQLKNSSVHMELKSKNTFKTRALSKKRLKSSEVHDKGWKLKSFYDMIIEEGEITEKAQKNIKQRNQIINKLKGISYECLKVQNGKEKIAQQIEVFAKYSEHINEKLFRKQRKLDKLHTFNF